MPERAQPPLSFRAEREARSRGIAIVRVEGPELSTGVRDTCTRVSTGTQYAGAGAPRPSARHTRVRGSTGTDVLATRTLYDISGGFLARHKRCLRRAVQFFDDGAPGSDIGGIDERDREHLLARDVDSPRTVRADAHPAAMNAVRARPAVRGSGTEYASTSTATDPRVPPRPPRCDGSCVTGTGTQPRTGIRYRDTSFDRSPGTLAIPRLRTFGPALGMTAPSALRSE